MQIFNLAEKLEKERKKNKELQQELKEANESITWWSNRYKAVEEEHKNCTRKHWQEKCAEHCANEKILQCRIDKAIEYINSKNKYYYENGKEIVHQEIINSIDLLNILKGSDKE